MARVKIFKKDGSATPYFWSDKNPGDRTDLRIYKRTPDGVKRMRGVRFNAVTNRVRKV